MTLLSVPGLFDNNWRNATIIGGMLMVIWIATLPIPRFLHRAVSVLAGASLYIYVSTGRFSRCSTRSTRPWPSRSRWLSASSTAASATRAMNLVERLLANRRTARGSGPDEGIGAYRPTKDQP